MAGGEASGPPEDDDGADAELETASEAAPRRTSPSAAASLLAVAMRMSPSSSGLKMKAGFTHLLTDLLPVTGLSGNRTPRRLPGVSMESARAAPPGVDGATPLAIDSPPSDMLGPTMEEEVVAVGPGGAAALAADGAVGVPISADSTMGVDAKKARAAVNRLLLGVRGGTAIAGGVVAAAPPCAACGKGGHIPARCTHPRAHAASAVAAAPQVALPTMMHLAFSRPRAATTVLLLCEPSDTWRKLRSRVAEALGVPVAAVKLYAGADKAYAFEDDGIVSDHHLADGATVLVSVDGEALTAGAAGGGAGH